jgi:hypothetical protein
MVSRCQQDGSWKIVLDNPMSFERGRFEVFDTGSLTRRR